MRNTALASLLLTSALLMAGCTAAPAKQDLPPADDPGARGRPIEDAPGPAQASAGSSTSSSAPSPGPKPTSSPPSSGTAPPPQTPPEEEPDNGTTTDWEGSITFGIGAEVPSVGYQPAEVLVRMPGDIEVPAGTKALLVELTWDPGAAGQDLTLTVWDADGMATHVDEGSLGSPDNPARLLVQDPAAGTWQAMGNAHMVTANMAYHIYATTFERGPVPEGFTKVPA